MNGGGTGRPDTAGKGREGVVTGLKMERDCADCGHAGRQPAAPLPSASQ